MKVKKCIIRFMFCVELCIFGYCYMYGKNGLQIFYGQKKELQQLEYEITTLQQEALLLEGDIHAWQTNDFYKEKVAREQLQMACKGDKLFYIGS